MNTPLFYHSKPTFGLDLGRSTVKIVQLAAEKKRMRVVGYGYAEFDRTAVKDGVIENPKDIAAAVSPVLKKIAVGKYMTNRVVASVPLAYTYTRIMSLPKMSNKDFAEAVRLEAEQYIPVPINDLYLEQHVIGTDSNSSDNKQVHVLMVAVPKRIISSLMELFKELDLEVAAIEPNMFANLRAVRFNSPPQGPQIIVDFGAQSSDLAIYDNAVRLTGTINKGGEQITQSIGEALKLSAEQANKLKVRYGISKSRWQAKLASALAPILTDYANEVQKMMRYYHDHSSQKATIKDIVVIGGGANMPGLADFLEHLTGVNVQICNPWQELIIKPLQPPPPSETTIYATAIGLALREFVND